MRQGAEGHAATVAAPGTGPAAPPATRQRGGGRHATAGRRAGHRVPAVAATAAVAAAYLALSLAMWWPVWSGHPSSRFLCACGDPGQYLWFFAAPAEALRHGHLPFFTGADYHPGGVNMLDNPGVLALAVAVSPVTWAFGPVATVNLVLLVTPVLSALAAFALLRRWLRWWPAAALGGLFYGFSPFVISELQYVHLQAAFLAIPPLVLLCLDELLVRQRRRPVPVGIALGVLATVQYLVSPEMVVLTALAAVIGTALVVAVAARRHPEELRRRVPAAVRGVGTGCAVAVALLAYPVWYALEGPRHTVGAPWPFIAKTGNTLADFLLTGRDASRQALQPGVFGYFGKAGPAQNYLGPTVLAAAATTVVLLRRSRLVQFGAVMAVVLAALSLGTALVGTPGAFATGARHMPPAQWWLPWQLVAHLPLASEASPGRLAGLTDLFVAVVCAAGLDGLVSHVRSRTARGHGGRANAPGRVGRDGSPGLAQADGPAGTAPGGDPAPAPAGTPPQVTGHAAVTGLAGRRPSVARRRALARRALPAAAGLTVAAAVLAPVGAVTDLPYATRPVAVPTWYTTAGAHLATGSVVLALPWGLSQTSAWQAIAGMHVVMAGGDAFVPGPDGRFQPKPAPGSAEAMLSAFTGYSAPPLATPGAVATLRRAIDRWQVTTVVVTGTAGSPAYAVGFLSVVLGALPARQDGAFVWSGVRSDPRPWRVPSTAVLACRPLTSPPATVARCVAAAAGAGSGSRPAATG